AGTVDDERDRGRRRDEGFFLYVEPEKRGGADPALISDEPPGKPGQRAADERRAPPGKAHPLREAGEAPDPREDKEQTEDDGERRALHDRLQGRTDKPADRARRAESEQHVSIDPRTDDEKANEGAGEVGERDHRDRETHIELRGEDGREHAADSEAGDRCD